MGGMKTPHLSSVVRVAIAALVSDLAGAEPPRDFRIIPAGEFRAWDGRPKECAAWVCNEEDGRRIVASLQARQSDRVIDYEHATLVAKKTGAQAEAAGWFKDAEWRDDGLWLIGVDWTALAAQQIVNKKYRYISPVFPYDKKTGRVLDLWFAALTNDPGVDGLTDLSAMAALAAEIFTDQPTNSEEHVNEELLEQLRWLLNLPVGTTPEEIATHLSKLIAQIKTDPVAANSARFDIGSHLAALSAQVATPDPALFVPVATLTALQGEHAESQAALAALQAEIASEKLEKIVGDGLSTGKLTPAMEAWARELGKKDVAALSAYLESAPVIAKPGETQTRGGAVVDTGVASLSAIESEVAAQLGVDPDAIKASKS